MRSAKCPKPRPKVTQVGRSGKSEVGEFLPGILDGERVIIYEPKKLTKTELRATRALERVIQKRAMVALACAGFFVRPHIIQACWKCYAPPVKQSGLGQGASDLFIMAKPLGRCGFIEIKRPGYTASEVRSGQLEFQRDVERWGAVAGIATNEDEALEIARRLMEVR